MFDYDPVCKAAVEVLDKYDLSLAFRDRGKVNTYDLAEIIMNEFPVGEVVDAVDNLSSDEIADYLVDRYNMCQSEIIHTYVELR